MDWGGGGVLFDGLAWVACRDATALTAASLTPYFLKFSVIVIYHLKKKKKKNSIFFIDRIGRLVLKKGCGI